MEFITMLIYGIIPMLLAITLHEAAHGFVAKKLGDSTAYSLGRVTLNPANHIDLYGTIIVPILMFIMSHGMMMFGWAKPVPVNESRLRNPKRDMILVALAGPAANFFMAILWAFSLILLSMIKSNLPLIEGLAEISKLGIIINLSFMAFNLIPILPLDGGRVLKNLLPLKLSLEYEKIEPYGQYIIMALVIFGLASFFTMPIINYSMQLISSVIHILV